ncbi:hypothetical protein [Curvivirga sp.]|uniref:hypothetical protein n=1 Tax=Curvivirga sp. TaxID=2856848 RepID=UPI003B5CDBDE
MKPEEDPAYIELLKCLPDDLKHNVDQLVHIWYKHGYNDGYAEGAKTGKKS